MFAPTGLQASAFASRRRDVSRPSAFDSLFSFSSTATESIKLLQPTTLTSCGRQPTPLFKNYYD